MKVDVKELLEKEVKEIIKRGLRAWMRQEVNQ